MPRRSPFAKAAPLTPRQRKKGLVLPLSEKEAQVLRAMLGRTQDTETLGNLRGIGCYPAAVDVLEKRAASTKTIYERLNRACDRRELAR